MAIYVIDVYSNDVSSLLPDLYQARSPEISVQRLGTEWSKNVPSLDAFSKPRTLPSPRKVQPHRTTGVMQEGTQDAFSSGKLSPIRPKSQNVLVVNKD